VSRSRKLKIVATAAGSVLVTMAVASIPIASADTCTLVVALPTGGTTTITVDAAPGTPPASLVPPGDTLVSANCTPSTSTSTTPTATVTTSTTTTPTGTTGPTSTTSTTPTTSTTTPQPATQPGSSKPSQPTSGPSGPTGAIGKDVAGVGTSTVTTTATTTKSAAKSPASTGPTGPGVPTPANPSFSFALPGPAPLGVPNFFIESFQIPPFLLPIYQAAGIEYDVPWQVLAGINEIETDYGRNLSVSSAGAVGWMQFLPSTWQRYGVDATGSGYADPYNPVDAIFAAARYLHAAGASRNLPQAIYSYNHAWWYVQSVLLRAKLIGGMPGQLIGALTGLVEGHFPVAAPAKYADNAVTALASRRVTTSNAAITIPSDPGATYTNVFANQGSPVIAVNDGKVVRVGHSRTLGNYVELQDSTGNVYTYAQLGQVPKLYPVPKPVAVTAGEIARELSLPSAPAPKGPATAGQQQSPALPSAVKANKDVGGGPISLPVAPASGSSASSGTPASSGGPATDAAPPTTIPQPMVKERLFADPSRPASYAAGGDLQIKSSAPAIANFENYFSDVLHLAKNQYTLKPLRAGSIVVAGTILGRLGAGTPTLASHLQFMVRPAGKNAPYIDPKPILDGWKLLEATAVYRAAGKDPFWGPGAKNPSVGQVLLMSKQQLTNRVLADPHVQIYACGRRDIQAGLIDRRILAVIEFLTASGLDPTVSGLECGHSLTASTGVDAAGATGASVDISKINNIPILGNQGPGSITDITIRRLLTLQGTFRPNEIVSLMSYKGQSSTMRLPDHANRIQVTYTPVYGQNKQLSAEIANLLSPGEWTTLINHISQIPEPIVPIAPSKYAIKVSGSP
jgi:Transglycosylase SLT domain/Peptidase family M23